MMIDRNSASWTELRSLIAARIERLRDDLESVGLSPEATRGEVSALRWVIAQVETEAPIISTFTVDYMQAHDPS